MRNRGNLLVDHFFIPGSGFKAMRKQPVHLPGRKPAPFLRRLPALLADLTLVGLMTRGWMLFGFGRFPGHVIGVLLLFSAVLQFLYFPLCHGLCGRTPGKWLFRIRMIRGSGEPMSLWSGFLREIFSWPGAGLGLFALFSLWPRLEEPPTHLHYHQMLSRFYFEQYGTLAPALMLGGVVLGTLSLLFFWMAPDRRIPHDYIADTFVCQEMPQDS